MRKCFLLPWLLIVTVLFPIGCTQTYPEAKLKEALKEICRKEYGVDNIDVKFAGDTIGVYLPLEDFFMAEDLKSAAVAGKVRNPEKFLDPSPEAREKIQDVLFSLSRVLLSTDKPIKFYVLRVADIKNPVLEFVFTGYVDDIKRVRSIDISREEYNRRMLHELRFNRAAVWQRPVRQFFADLEHLSDAEFEKKYFTSKSATVIFQKQSLRKLMGLQEFAPETGWEILEMRSAMIHGSQVIAYVRVRPQNWKELPDYGVPDLEYLFTLSFGEEESRIERIVPFQTADEEGKLKKIAFAKKFHSQESLSKWEEEFPLREIHLSDFLAEQLNKRVQVQISTDERIQNTFRKIKLDFEYHASATPNFSLKVSATLQDINLPVNESVIFHEDMLYLLNIAVREFANVLRSYHFEDYDHLSLSLVNESTVWNLKRENLELFRRKKIDMTGLLNSVKA